tara:strand:- start:287 stop:1432 length:1146 start_codon:yes stop_codon:yes gene_type:complete
MSSGKNLQEMEVGTAQSKTAVNANAAAPMGAEKSATPVATPGQAAVEDLGGPTPENYKTDDDSAKLKTPGATLKQVRDIVNKGAKPAEPMPTMSKEEEEVEVSDEQEVVSEDEDLRTEVENEISESEEETEEVVAEEEIVEIDVDADIQALIQGEELSEDFQEKARMIFETAINAKVATIKEEMEANYATVIEEQVTEFKNELTERVDSYLEYVASEWIEENQLSVEEGLKAEMSESFLVGMKQLFEEHYVSIPEDKYDVLESMVNKLDEMEGKLNEQIDRNVALNKRLAESVTDGILSDVSEGLAVTQKEKLASLSESVEFDSETDYREKLVTLREAYFPSKPSAQRDSSEFIAEEATMNQDVSGSMAGYLTALGRVTKK